ncbi:MAG: Agmatine deiminase [Bacteroidota bacterium]|nr:Agmatine deiminase [Bacteroidota bacterium]
MKHTRLPAEWDTQDAIQIAFPGKNSDWKNYWDEIIPCYVNIIKTIASFQPLLIVCENVNEAKGYLKEIDQTNLFFFEIPINDTWARDHGAITVEFHNELKVYDFTFNGWGNKFDAEKDNLITQRLRKKGIYNTTHFETIDMVLEGGSIESNGKGTLLTTSQCLLSPERNPGLSQKVIEDKLIDLFGLERVLWLHHGHLEGDDTDSHIDTLARFCDDKTIAYVQCTDESDPHFSSLKKMEEELQLFKTLDGEPYQLIPLPMADAVYADDDRRRLPATYANFLILNEVVLMPTYGGSQDLQALVQLQKAFPVKKVTGIDCKALLLQHGSLHCITMQYPKGAINWSIVNEMG